MIHRGKKKQQQKIKTKQEEKNKGADTRKLGNWKWFQLAAVYIFLLMRQLCRVPGYPLDS